MLDAFPGEKGEGPWARGRWGAQRNPMPVGWLPGLHVVPISLRSYESWSVSSSAFAEVRLGIVEALTLTFSWDLKRRQLDA